MLRNSESKLANWPSNSHFYWLHSHHVSKMLMVLHQHSNI